MKYILILLSILLFSCEKQDPFEMHVEEYSKVKIEISDVFVETIIEDYTINEFRVEVVEQSQGKWCRISLPELKWEECGTAFHFDLVSGDMGFKVKPINCGDKIKRFNVKIFIDGEPVDYMEIEGKNLSYMVNRVEEY